MDLYYVAPCRTSFPSMSASSIHMIKMCEAYADLGYRVFLVLSETEVGEKEIKKYYGVKKDFNIIKIKVPKSKVGNVFYIIKSLFFLINKRSFVFVGRSVGVLSLLSLLGKKVTLDIHGPVWNFNKLDYFLFRKAVFFNRFYKVTVNSYALKKMYLEKGILNNDEILVAYNGSDFLSGFDRKDGVKNIAVDDKINVGYFGGLYKGRGIDLILDLACVLDDFHFHFFGGSESEISKFKCDLINVTFHGHVKHSDVAYYRAQCDILLAPYSSNGVAVAGGGGDSSEYMNPIKIIEYMASGKAIVVSDLPVLKEILDSDSALFAKPDDLNSWRDALIKLKNNNLRKKIGDNAQKKFLQGLTWKERAKKLI